MKKIKLLLFLASLLSLPIASGSSDDLKKKAEEAFLDSVRRGDLKALKAEMEKSQKYFNIQIKEEVVHQNKTEWSNLLGIAFDYAFFVKLLDKQQYMKRAEEQEIIQLKKDLQLGKFSDYTSIVNYFLDLDTLELKMLSESFNNHEEFLLQSAIQMIVKKRWQTYQMYLEVFITKVESKNEKVGNCLLKTSTSLNYINDFCMNIIKKLVKKQNEKNKNKGEKKDDIGINKDFRDDYPLDIAVLGGPVGVETQIEIIKLLLSCRVAKQETIDGALIKAVECKAPRGEVIAELIRHGGNPLAKQDGHDLPIDTAFNKKDPKIFKELLASSKTNKYLPFLINRSINQYKGNEQAIMQVLLEKIDKEFLNKKVGNFIEYAIKMKNEDAFRLIVKRSKELDQEGIKKWYASHSSDKQVKGETHLDLAVENGQNGIAEWLRNNKDIPTSLSKAQYDSLPLHKAVIDGDGDKVQELLTQGSSPNSVDSYHQTPLHLAVILYEKNKENAKKIIKLLLDNQNIKPNMRSQLKLGIEHTPLSLACEKGYREIISILLNSKKIDPNLVYGAKKDTLLHQSVKNGWLEIVGLLLSKTNQGEKIKPNLLNDDHEHVLFSALYIEKKQEMVKLLLSCDEIVANIEQQSKSRYGDTFPHVVASRGEVEVMKTLLDRIPSLISLKSSAGYTILHQSIRDNQIDMTNLLLKIPAVNPNIKTDDDQKNTPLHLAAKPNKLKVLSILLGNPNVDPNIQNGSGKNPFHQAVENDYQDVVENLFNVGGENKCQPVDLNSTTKSGDTALHLAVRKNNEFMVQALCAFEATRLDIENEKGETAIYIAVDFGYLDIVKLLLNSAVNKKNSLSGVAMKKLLERAQARGEQEIVNILKNYNKTYIKKPESSGREDTTENDKETKKINQINHREVDNLLPGDGVNKKENKEAKVNDKEREKSDQINHDKVNDLLPGDDVDKKGNKGAKVNEEENGYPSPGKVIGILLLIVVVVGGFIYSYFGWLKKPTGLKTQKRKYLNPLR